MSLLWGFVFSVLCLEFVLAFLLFIPYVNTSVRWLIRTTTTHTVTRRLVATTGLAICFLFVSTLMEYRSLRAKLADPTRGASELNTMLQFRHQRNLYLTGFTLLGGALLWALGTLSGKFQSALARIQELEAHLQKSERRVAAVASKIEADAERREVLSAEALKSQVAAQQREYLRVLQENEELHDKVRKSVAEKKKD